MIEDIYQLSPMQQGMLFHTLYSPEAAMYVEQMICTLRGPLDVPAFERAWQKTMQRNAILRTAFVWEGIAEPVQVVHHAVPIKIAAEDLRPLPPAEQENRLQEYLIQDRMQGFDLLSAPLMRLALFRVADDAHRFVWTHHHILIDGWSLPLLLQEVFGYYEAIARGAVINLPPRPPFRDYIAWLQQQDLSRAEAFWRRTLQGVLAPTPLPFSRVVPEENAPGADYAMESLALPQAASAALAGFVRQQQLTINSVVMGAWALLLGKYSGDKEIIFGSTVSGRPPSLAGSESMIGLFINTLPVRAQIRAEMPLLDWLRELQLMQAESREYEYSSLTQIKGWSQMPADSPLFENILVFENYPVAEELNSTPLSFRISDLDFFARTNYPLTLVCAPGEQITFNFAYECAKFSRRDIRKLLERLVSLIEQILARPQQKVADLTFLDAAEIRQQLVEWNTTAGDFRRDQCLHQLFEEVVRQYPDNRALTFAGSTLSYAELNRRANRLAHQLRERGVAPEVCVGICMERSPEMIISVLAVLKAGGAYVPVDPAYPEERIAYMLTDSGVKLLLTTAPSITGLSLPEIDTLFVDTEEEPVVAASEADLAVAVRPENLAYIIYTSGSTGKPKGTMLTHRGIVNFIEAMMQDVAVMASDRVLQFASFSFDASVAEIFLALCSGATLALARREILMSVEELTQLLQQEAITTVTLPPSMLALLPAGEFPALRNIVSAGEACSWQVQQAWAPHCRFFNGYGPTETTVGATWIEVRERLPYLPAPQIGRPIHNVRNYLLDQRGGLVPAGVTAEITIAGEGVARGYLNRPDLTADRFIPDPYSGVPGARMYRSGDFGWYMPNGQIAYAGRIDKQVKIRGFRIELGEIIDRINQYPGIVHSTVLAREDVPGSKRLVAYLVPEKGAELSGSALHDHLKAHLPEYMLPSAYVTLEAMPLTPNGKINTAALPAPEQSTTLFGGEYVAPRNPIEEILAGLYQEILHVGRAGIEDNFFALGGHSLLATQLLSRIRDSFQADIPLRLIFEHPTIRELAEILAAAKRDGVQPDLAAITPAPRDRDLPLSFAQQRLWFLDQLEPDNAFYNIPVALRLEGSLDKKALEESFRQLIRRHESLRTIFVAREGEPFQQILPEGQFTLDERDLTAFPAAEREAEVHRQAAEEAQTPFDLSRGPLLRCAILTLADQDHALLLTMHHIISDGWSMQLFIQELIATYQALTAAQEPELPALALQYADFAVWQRQWLQNEVLQNELAYWENKLTGAPPLLELPLDHPRPAVQSFNGAVATRQLSAELTEALRRLGQREGATLYMTLLTAFAVLLHRYSGQNDFNIGTPVANRNHQEIEKIIGFFVNSLVLRMDLSENPTLLQLLQRVRETSLEAYTHQDIPFEMLVEKLHPTRDLSHSPLFQVMFVMQNLPEAAIDLPDLTIRPVEFENGTSKFDLTLTMAEGSAGLQAEMEFNCDLFLPATIDRMLNHLVMILEAMAQDPEQGVSALPLLTEAENRLILEQWNATGHVYPDQMTVHEWFEALAASQPQAPALSFLGQETSYDELNRRANQLARHLHRRGIGPESLIGICMDRSPEMVVGMLGALKAGGAFVPIDPNYPEARISYMLNDSGIAVLLTQSEIARQLPPHQANDLALDSDWALIAGENDSNFHLRVLPHHLAYVIYTSGSTGQPKGTMLQHQGVCNLATAQKDAFKVGPGSRILQFSSLSFDASVWETVMALLSGATLCLAPRDSFVTGQGLLSVLIAERITTVTLPPSVLTVMPEEPLPHLQTIITAGEKCSTDLVSRWGGGRRFFNAYGPTETTVCASMYLCADAAISPPIGRPLYNFELYVVDRHLQPVPLGAAGELLVGGVGLARGYLRRPELTAEKFVPHPFSAVPGARLYRTGDLVRYLPDGNIEFLGRIDHQIKVRGFRIELGEIESLLKDHPEIVDVIVVPHSDTPGDIRLFAYLVCRDGMLTASQVRSYLKEHLPEYMVPSGFIFLEQMPLTPSGKIDRKALPQPDQERPAMAVEYVAPRTPAEENLARICAELLHLERVGIHDNFFDLGGHSLLATQFISRLRDQFQVEVPVRMIFETPTIADLAAAIERLAAQPPALQDNLAAIKAASRENRRVRVSSLTTP